MHAVQHFVQKTQPYLKFRPLSGGVVNASIPGQLAVLIMKGLDNRLVPRDRVSLPATNDTMLDEVAVVREMLSDEQQTP